MRTKEAITADLTSARTRLALYLNREAEMLSGGVQSYGIGSRNLTRYNTDLAAIRDTIKQLKQEIAELEAELAGGKPRRAVGVVPRDW
jgi:cell division protein FtsB